MRSPAVRKAIHARLHPRQAVVPVGPAMMPPPPQDASPSYFTTGGAMTASAAPTATMLVIDTTAIGTPLIPTPLSRVRTSSVDAKTVSINSVSSTATFLSSTVAPTSTAAALPTVAIDPFQQVYTAMTVKTLHSLPPWVTMGAIGGAVLMVLLAAYCYICRWYYKRLPRSAARWDIDDRVKNEPVYGDEPRFTPSEEEKHSPLADDDRRSVPVGDSYFPQGEAWHKFEGRTAHHPESFIYTGDGQPGYSPTSPPLSGTTAVTPNSSTGLARPYPQFARPKRGQIDSVFSTVSFPTTHRADSIRESGFYPDGSEYEHDGEVWDLASPSFQAGETRPSLDSTARSVSVARASLSVNRASMFGEASARGRGSMVVYESEPARMSILDEDPFAGPGEGNGGTYVFPIEKYGGKRSLDGGQKSTDGHDTRTRPRDVRALGTLDEADEDLTRSGKSTPIPRL